MFAAAIAVSGALGLVGDASFVQAIDRLGYPRYLLTILGAAKLLGAAALLQGKFPRLKEWAYAGFAFDLLGAATSYAAVGDWRRIAIPSVYALLLLASYLPWRLRTSLIRET